MKEIENQLSNSVGLVASRSRFSAVRLRNTAPAAPKNTDLCNVAPAVFQFGPWLGLLCIMIVQTRSPRGHCFGLFVAVPEVSLAYQDFLLRLLD